MPTDEAVPVPERTEKDQEIDQLALWANTSSGRLRELLSDDLVEWFSAATELDNTTDLFALFVKALEEITAQTITIAETTRALGIEQQNHQNRIEVEEMNIKSAERAAVEASARANDRAKKAKRERDQAVHQMIDQELETVRLRAVVMNAMALAKTAWASKTIITAEELRDILRA